jgi:hypothetical protein
LYQLNISKLKDKHSLKEKLSGYQSAKIIKYALIEGPAFFSIVIALNTENSYFLTIAAALIGYLYFQKPTKEQIESDLELTGKMRSQFQKMDEPVD